jgi:hypothetical protein
LKKNQRLSEKKNANTVDINAISLSTFLSEAFFRGFNAISKHPTKGVKFKIQFI